MPIDNVPSLRGHRGVCGRQCAGDGTQVGKMCSPFESQFFDRVLEVGHVGREVSDVVENAEEHRLDPGAHGFEHLGGGPGEAGLVFAHQHVESPDGEHLGALFAEPLSEPGGIPAAGI